MSTDIITTYIDTFDDTHGAIYGTARFNVETAFYYDADIGGSDGWETTAELVDLRIGGSTVNREWLVNAFSETMIAAVEAQIAEEHQPEMEAA